MQCSNLISQSKKHASRIEVCGGIASGKTTFATLLKGIGVKTIIENFQLNPFWKAFYRDPLWHAFETEITFLLQHYHQIKVSSIHDKVFICDFSLMLDLAYADVTLQGSKRDAFLAVYNEAIHDLPPPALLIYLRCEAAVELERIRKRGRVVESSINLEYLSALNSALEDRVHEASKRTNVISIDSEQKNFATNNLVQEELISLVQQKLLEYEGKQNKISPP